MHDCKDCMRTYSTVLMVRAGCIGQMQVSMPVELPDAGTVLMQARPKRMAPVFSCLFPTLQGTPRRPTRSGGLLWPRHVVTKESTALLIFE